MSVRQPFGNALKASASVQAAVRYRVGMKLPFLASLVAATISTVVVSASATDPVPLFNGKDLSGWIDVNTSASTWTVAKDETGTPVIKCTGIPTGILRTEKAYENFVLEFDWKHLSEPGNAGLFVWSDPYCAKGVPFSRSIEVQIMLTPDNIDAQGRTMYTGQGDIFSIWGARMKPDRPHPGGWERCLPSARMTKGKGEWNHYKVTCNNGVIKLEVNGTEVSGASEVTPRKGFICLESEGTEIWFKNLKITELPPATPPIPADMTADLKAGGMRPMFDALVMQGWKEGAERGEETPKHWTVSNGVVRFDGKGKSLWSDESYWRWTDEHQGRMPRPVIGPDGNTVKNPDGTDKTVEVDERDSGIYLRGSSKSQVNIWSWPVGSGEVYGYRTDGSMPAEVRAAVTPKMQADAPIGEWNRFRIRMVGETLNVWLNGKHVIVDARLPGVAKSGPIALQSHGCPIEFYNVMIQRLD
jgi:opacity protein-like surface antigen